MPKLYINPDHELATCRYMISGPTGAWWLMCGDPPSSGFLFGDGGSQGCDDSGDFPLSLVISEDDAMHLCRTFREPDDEPALKSWIDAKRTDEIPSDRRVEVQAIDSDGDTRTVAFQGLPPGGVEQIAEERKLNAWLAHLENAPASSATPTVGRCIDVIAANLRAQPVALRDDIIAIALRAASLPED